MKRFFAVIAFCSVCACFGFAQASDDAPASKEDIEKYLQAVHVHEMMTQMIVAMTKPMHQMVHEQCVKDKESLPADCEARMNKMMDEMMRKMPLDEMIQATIPTYQKHFTRGDIETLTAFYSGPTGQKVLREMPSIMAESMESVMPIMRKNIDSMSDQVQRQVAQMKKQPSGGSAAPSKN